MHFLYFHAFVPANRKEQQTLKLYFAIIFAAGILFSGTARAITNCDEQAKPAFDCPTGYTMMCIPVGGDHWGCGKESNGQIVEWDPNSQTNDNTAVPVVDQQIPPAPPESPVINTVAPPAITQEQTPPQPQTATEEPPPIEVISENSPQIATERGMPINTLISKAPYVIAVAAGISVFFWLGWREWRKWKKRSVLPPVGGAVEKTICGTCGGSGKVKRKRMRSVPCGHCKKSGRDICHHCGGTGRYGVGLTVPQTEEEVQSMMKCDYCEGSGFPKIPIACCMCKGKRKEEFEETYEVPCPDCKGTGYR